MTLVLKTARAEVWHDLRADEFYVYANDRLVRVCPSIGMAREVAAGA
jgi:hypothetical protein